MDESFNPRLFGQHCPVSNADFVASLIFVFCGSFMIMVLTFPALLV